ncbi:type IV secretory system conjugative DNA transfer family protein [Pseudonocardia abyssalis]|jgi:type IV secretion system protein VirD4|uniref:TraM recognition domain-containing protein n=1 Tax=Pseudonocardia abyssalis TaxID=2792008 RepID=A0ABS6UTA5_9PSEU|nr:type IV secretory system conjugative DNA transfer family protein [Pseudonocardia abyssalis]MBW0117189.1 TraM recognition domain-containing protein [Pseudonocardia abyssalis]MBW0135088.1 TraM recognition domain-containing protein [Pseudonocardia abyssalis]
MSNPISSILRDAAAPLLLLGAIATAGIAAVDVWVAAVVAAGPGPVPALSFDLPLRVARDGIDVVLSPAASTTAFVTALAALVGVELAAVAGVVVMSTRGGRLGDPRRSLLRRRDLGDLSGRGSARRARHLRPSLDQRADVPATERGIRMVRIAGRDVWMSWEDVALVIMGPRANKTSAVAVPAVLSAPGLVVATSNKADLWALTSGLRGEVGAVWTFDPQQIAHAEQRWWWDPLRSVREAPDAHRYEAASRLAEHFMGTIGGTRRDPFFHAAGEQVLVGTLLAAALSGGTLRDVLLWLQYGRRDAITALDNAGAGLEAADLEASLAGADVTTKGIFQTARTATKALTSERILRWITPPETWRTPPRDPQRFLELDPWQLLAEAAIGPVTTHLLSKEGAGTAAPVVAALVDRILEVAELSAQASGGRLDPPVVAVLDEAANICPIKTLPQLYSHFGSRGIQVITMLQSYQQGVGVWGNQGMDALWSAATIKLVGAGVDDHEFLRRLSGLVGDHDVEKMSTSYDRSRGPSRQYSTTREPVLPVSVLRALPRSQAVLLATGRRAGLGELQPWYQEDDAVDIRTYSTVALAELRAAAQEALGLDNPFTTSAGTSPRGGEPS